MFVEHDFYIGFRDINSRKELTNSSMLAALEDTAGEHSFKANNSLSDEHSWVLLNWKVRILKRPQYHETLTIKTWSRCIDKFYAFRDFQVYNQEQDLVCIATSKWIYFDLKKGKIIKVPPEVGNAYQTEHVSVFPEEENQFLKLKLPETYEKSMEFKITRNMIDTNHHLHNIYYLDIAKEIIPEEYISNQEFDNFEVIYKKEIKYGDTIKVFYTKEKEKHIVTIKNNDETETHAIIILEEL